MLIGNILQCNQSFYSWILFYYSYILYIIIKIVAIDVTITVCERIEREKDYDWLKK